MLNQSISLEKCPALVLNADYRPLSYYPLSLWSWQDSIKSVFLNRVSIVSYYDRVVRSPSFSMKLPSVIALKDFIKPLRNPNFTRFNVFLRDKFTCQYCGNKRDLTFDHLLPKSKVTKTQDGNVILIELENSGWKFSANNHLIDVESGLYFGNKNSFVENQNIFISGNTQKEDQVISWIIEKI